MNRDKLLNDVRNIVPKKPGCYIYKNKNNEIIYVGKAKNLINRMSSYFNRINNLKTTKLVEEINSFEYIITKNEREALILENNLIKKYNPKYNILLKDDKRYPFILLTKEKHPKLLSVRNTKIKGSYFGPFPSSGFTRDIIEILNKEIPLRKCKKIPKEECIYYHINQCYAPCIMDIDESKINIYVEDIKKYLGGSFSKLKTLLTNKMMKKAENLEFEEAQALKILITQLNEFKESQAVEVAKDVNIDIIGTKSDSTWVAISIVSVRKGKVLNISNGLTSHNGDTHEAIISYLFNQYSEESMPENFYIEDEKVAKDVSSIFISNLQNIHLNYYKNLISMANINANEYFKKNIDKITKEIFAKNENGYSKLKEFTKNKLEIIEMYDISHTAGDAQVGAKIAFENGKKNPKLYRKYKIKNAKASDDYGSIKEVIERRIIRMIKEGEKSPDMIIVDGGKGQVSSALEILEKYGLENKIILIGLAKDDKHTTRAIVNKHMQEKELKRNDSLYKFFYKMQEEVHRFAIDFHRTVKTKSMFTSKLDNIKGLGIKRKRLLIDNFHTVENIQKASVEDITQLSIPKSVAINILKQLND